MRYIGQLQPIIRIDEMCKMGFSGVDMEKIFNTRVTTMTCYHIFTLFLKKCAFIFPQSHGYCSHH